MNFKPRLFLIVCLVLSACGTLTIEKRTYRNGFHISWNKKFPTSTNDASFKQVDEKNEKTPSSNLISSTLEKPSFLQVNKAITNDSLTTFQDDHQTEIGSLKLTITRVKQTEISKEKRVLKGEQVRLNQSQHFHFSNWWLFSILIFPFVIYRKSHHQKLARWAQRNAFKTKILLVFTSIIGAGLSLYIGHSLNFQYAPLVAISSVLGVASGILIYKHSSRDRNYEQQRNKRLLGLNLINVSAYLSFFGLGGSHIFTNKSAFSSWNNFQLLLTETPETRVHTTGETVALVIAAILVLLIIGFITAVASCYLACLGFNVIAVVVGVVGFFLASYLSGLLFLYAYKKKTDEKGKIAKRALWSPLIALGISVIVLGIMYLVTLTI